MVAKLVVLILSVAVVGATLLTLRQQRLQAVYDMTDAIERASELDRELWRVRIEIARLTRPERIERLAENLGDLEPIPMEWCEPLAGAEEPHDRIGVAPDRVVVRVGPEEAVGG